MASVKANKNKRGRVISYRIRCCVGRDPSTLKQVWRTCTVDRPENMTPKEEATYIRRLSEDWEKQQRADYKKGLEPNRDKMTLMEFVNGHWWPNSIEAARHAPNTLISYRKLSNTVLEHFGAIRLVEITPERVGAFVRWMKVDKGYSDRTTRMHYDILRGVLSYAVSCGYLDASPIDAMRPQDKPTVPYREPDFLTVEEIKAFLDALEADEDMPGLWKAYFQLLIFAGVRRAEAFAVQWADYDESRKELIISKSVTLTGNPGAETAIKSPKNGRRRRVPVSSALATALEARRLEVMEHYGAVNPSWFIFGAVENPEKPINPNTAYDRLSAFQKKHGLRRVSVHILRHSFASLCLQGGGNLKQLQAVLGHNRASTTLLFYAGIAESQNREAVNAVEKLIKDNVSDK
ncbi:MAG: site-specific integrase [Oscillibacter sp.]|nr:site-specific integrase [Oscillibacter sp.]